MAASMPALEEWVRPGDVAWWWSVLAVGMGRTADMFSTWIGTPGLRNEGNPFARWLGWRKGILLNVLVVPLAACWPMIAVSLATTSAMVAARNLHTVWLMRMMGEDAYRDWFGGWMHATPRILFLGCHRRGPLRLRLRRRRVHHACLRPALTASTPCPPQGIHAPRPASNAGRVPWPCRSRGRRWSG